jgi:hypothetical protein
VAIGGCGWILGLSSGLFSLPLRAVVVARSPGAQKKVAVFALVLSSTRAPRPIVEGVKAKQIKLERLVEADWNANRVGKAVLAKVRRSVEEFGLVENLVARPHPEQPGRYELLSGNHRLRVLRELGFTSAPVVVVELGDAQARLLAQTLNRTRGADDTEAYARLVERVLLEYRADEVAGFLPETEASIERLLHAYGSGQGSEPALLEPPVEWWRSCWRASSRGCWSPIRLMGSSSIMVGGTGCASRPGRRGRDALE